MPNKKDSAYDFCLHILFDECRADAIREHIGFRISEATLLAPFTIFLLARLLAALYSPIQDCDEVFNFWEPTHYLNHGYGMQTWELSPVYAIRSWLYITLHALPVHVASWMPFEKPKTFEFYSLRFFLAALCAFCETRLYAAVSRAMNPRIAIIFLIVAVSSAGNFHATTSYLSSSFAMYSVVLSLSEFLNQQGGLRTARGLTWLGVGTILGWPFVAVLSLPFVLEELGWMLSGVRGVQAVFTRLIRGLTQSLLVLVDTIFPKAVAGR